MFLGYGKTIISLYMTSTFKIFQSFSENYGEKSSEKVCFSHIMQGMLSVKESIIYEVYQIRATHMPYRIRPHNKYVKMIFNAKLEMFDITINFKGLYSSDLLCPFCTVVKEIFRTFSIVNLSQYAQPL